jgi:hypothetical protein
MAPIGPRCLGVHAHPWHKIRRIRPDVEVLPSREAKRVVDEAGRMLSEAFRYYRIFWSKTARTRDLEAFLTLVDGWLSR